VFFLFLKLIFDLCFDTQPQTPFFAMSANSDDQILEHDDGDDQMEELSTQVQLLSVTNGIVAEIPNRGGRTTDGTSFVERISFERTSERNSTSRDSLPDHVTLSGLNPSAADVAYDRRVMVVSSALDAHNRTPQAVLGMQSPLDLVDGRELPGVAATRGLPSGLQRGDQHTSSDTGNVDEGVPRHGGPFPIFLTDLSIMRAIRRADDAHIDRHGQPAISAQVSEQYRRIAGDEPWDNAARTSHLDFHSSLGLSGPETSSSGVDLGGHEISLPAAVRLGHESSQVLPPAAESRMQSALPAKFGVPGQETASVLQISKRPHLRAKDIAHRRFLVPVVHDQDQQVPLYTGSPIPLPTNPRLNTVGYPDVSYGPTSSNHHGFHALRFTPAPQRVEETFVVMLLFGQRRDIALMWGEVVLHQDHALGDYLSRGDFRGSIITVVSSVGIITTPAPPVPRSASGGGPPLSPRNSKFKWSALFFFGTRHS
jgi:hypothetical protein